MKFKDYELDTQIKRALSELGYTQPLEVQEIVLPKLLAGQDVVVQSQTGSGKTAAFAIPLIERVNLEEEGPQVVVLAPTRELALQVHDEIEDIGRHKGVKSTVVFGKQPMEAQRRALREKPHIVVGTPGRVLDHIIKKNVKFRNLKYLVIDEADEILLMGFKEQLEAILEKLPKERVTALFSATMPQDVIYMSQLYTNKAETIRVESKKPTIDKIEQIYYAVEGLKKVDFMKKMIRHEDPKKCIIFCNTQTQVDNLFDIFRKWDYNTCAVHGGMDQGLRMNMLKDFKRGRYRILIATDVAARGLHVSGLTHVINYGVPFEHEQYVHRIGRTGRVEEHGIAITLVIPKEVERFEALQNYLGYEIPCKGGHIRIERGQSTKNKRHGKERYKEDKRKDAHTLVHINAGLGNSRLKQSDILSAFRSVEGVAISDIGKIDMKDNFTKVAIYNDKAPKIIKAFRTKKIRGKAYIVRKA